MRKEIILESTESKKGNNREARREKFIRIAERRVNKILNDFDSLGKCADKKNYEYTYDDVKKIFQTIEKKTKAIKAYYQNSSEKTQVFTLKKL